MTLALTRSTENMVTACGDLEDVWVCALSSCLQPGEAIPSELSVCLTELQDNNSTIMYITPMNNLFVLYQRLLLESGVIDI
ncbi:hypothetical protein BDR07DRAFT_451879 [Suillus spraguei]|nr:hypothetical protein BDR07DRAFT_451879 [Suillus spraguei]